MQLKLDRLTKQYGSKIAVDRVSATLTRGVYGLLGANGAGKTTLMRMLCGILTPTSGEVLLNGESIYAMDARYRDLLGYLPQDFGYYPRPGGGAFLFCAASQLFAQGGKVLRALGPVFHIAAAGADIFRNQHLFAQVQAQVGVAAAGKQPLRGGHMHNLRAAAFGAGVCAFHRA